MAVKTPDSKREQDEAYNLSQQQVDERFNHIVGGQTNTANDLQKLENYANNGTADEERTGTKDETSDPTRNIDNVAAGEQNAGNAINYTGGGGQGTSAKKPMSIREGLRGRGPLGILVALLFAGGGALTVFFSPGILVIDLKEKYVEKFNDQLAVMDDQSYLLLKKKFKGQGTVVGCTKLSIRCKFNTLSDRQLKKMERGGLIKVTTTGDTTLIKGRNKIDSLEFNGKTITAENLIKEADTDKEFRRALRGGYNPKLAGFADTVFTKLSRKVGINKQQNLTGKTKEELDNQVKKATSGAAAAEVDARVSSTEEDCRAGSEGCVNGKKTVYRDSNGNIISKATYDSRINASGAFKAEIDARKTLSETGGIALKSTLKGALTSTALGLGAVDSACTGYTLIRAVGFAAKYLGMLQLLRYFQVAANTADADKGGDGIAEANTYLGNIITSTNSQGKSGTDSYGYKYTVYGDTAGMPRSDDVKPASVSGDGSDAGKTQFTLNEEEKQRITTNDEVTKYINGQLVSDNLLTDIINLTGYSGTTDEIDAGCGFIKSGWGQTIVIGTAIAGAVVAFFTGGASLGWGIAAQTAVSVSITVALAMLTPKLYDMASGTLINNKENGNQAVNAFTSGAGGMNTQTFMARAIPILQKEDAVAYQEKTAQVLAQYAEEDRLEHGPLDPTNRNTFMGSIVSNLIPYATKMSSLTSAVPTVMSLSANSIGGLFPRAGAVNSRAQYDICQDRDYIAENAAADPFCNLHGGFTPEVMNIDSDVMLTYMISNDYINEETGEPKASGNEYAAYLRDCADRSVPIGGYTEDNPDKGTKCIQGRSGPTSATSLKSSEHLATLASTKKDTTLAQAVTTFTQEDKLNMFRKMSVLMGVNEGMDNGEVAQNATKSSSTTISGDARQLALQVVDNDNIRFIDPDTEAQLKAFGGGGTITNQCGKPMTISKYLLGALLTNATKYKILVNNIGFREDRNVPEDCKSATNQHSISSAVDINDIEVIGGGSTGGSISLPGGDAAIVTQYANDFLAALPLNRGGVGQKNNGINPTFPPGSVALNGSHSFPDRGNHLHIDARNRENLNDTE
jgi:hypothetical protein